jgi:hypothetical protein
MAGLRPIVFSVIQHHNPYTALSSSYQLHPLREWNSLFV